MHITNSVLAWASCACFIVGVSDAVPWSGPRETAVAARAAATKTKPALTSSTRVASAGAATLLPAIHPDRVKHRYENLIPSYNYSMFYAGSGVYGGVNSTNIGIINVPNAKYPALQLQESIYVSSIVCSGPSILVGFNDTRAFKTASSHWKNDFVIILYVPGCGDATDGSLRTYHLVNSTNSIRNSTLSITLTAESIDINAAIGDEHPISVDFGSWNSNATLDTPMETTTVEPGSLITAAPKMIRHISRSLRPGPRRSGPKVSPHVDKRDLNPLDCLTYLPWHPGSAVTCASNAISSIESWIADETNSALNFFDSVTNDAYGVYTSISEEGDSYYDWVTSDAEYTYESLTDEASGFYNSVTEDAENFYSSVTADAENSYSSLSSEAAQTIAAASADLVSVLSSAADAASTMIDNAENQVQSILSAAQGDASAIESLASAGFSNIIASATQEADGIIGDASSYFSNMLASATSEALSIESVATAAVASMYSSLTANFPSVTETLQSSGDDFPFDSLTEFGDAIPTIWGIQGYLVDQHTLDNGTVDLSIYCVGCDVSANLVISGSATFVLGLDPQILDGAIEVSGSLGIFAGIGITAGTEQTWTKNVPILRKGLPELSIGSLFILGPEIVVEIDGSLGLNAESSVLAGIGVSWPSVSATMDILDTSNSSISGFSDYSVQPIVNVDASVDATAEVTLSARINFGIDINAIIKKHYEVGVVEQPGFLVNASTTTSFELENGVMTETIGNDDCPGVNFGMYFVNEVFLDILDIATVTFEATTIPIFVTCFTLDTPSTSYSADSSVTTVTTISPDATSSAAMR